MDLRHLRSCVVIADAGSFSEAARRMHIAQPALSERIAELELELGIALFERSRRGITPTDAGIYFIDKARSILLEAAALKTEMQAKKCLTPVKLRIGISATLSSLFVPRLFELCRQIAPHAEIALVEGVAHELTHLMTHGGVDFVVSHGIQESASIVIQPLANEPLCAIYQNELFALPKPLSLQALLEYPLLVPHRAMALRALLEQHASRLGYVPKYASDIDTLTGLVAAAQAGLGIVILPKVALHGLHTLHSLSIECIEPRIDRTVCMAFSMVSPHAALSRTLSQSLQPVVTEWINSGQWAWARAIGAGDGGQM